MYTKDVTRSTEVAVQQTPATTAEATSTQAIHPEAGTLPDVTDSTDTTTVYVEPAQEAQTGGAETRTADDVMEESGNPVAIDQELVQKLTAKFNLAMTTPRFWENTNRLKRLDEALNIPVYDDRSMQQFYISAKDELTQKAMETAITTNMVPERPTDEQIHALAIQKSEAKRKKDAAKAAKK